MHAAVLIHNTSHPLGTQLREMVRDRLSCPLPILISFDQAEEVLARGRITMLVVVLSPFPERALHLLRKLRGQVAGPVLAVGLASESKLILRALHEGADHYLDEADLETQLDAVLLRLQIKEEASKPPAGRLIAMLGASGGSGTSTLAVNLATALASAGAQSDDRPPRCALIDLKPGVGDLAALLDLKPTHNLADLCLNAGRLDRAMFESALVSHASGVHLLAPPQMFEDIRLVTAQGVQKSLSLARESAPFTVVDLEDCFHEEQMVVLRQADLVLLVFRLDFTSLRSTRRILDYLEQAGISEDRVRLVINRYGQAKELPLSEAEDALSRKIPYIIPDDPKTINAANNAGVPAILRTPSAKVSQSIVQMANNLVRPEAGKASGVLQAVRSVNGWLAAFHG
jgi:pilus assembly protein CpaE